MQTKAGKKVDETRSIKIDTAKTIATVGLKMNLPNEDGEILGIKLYSDDYEEMVNETWNPTENKGVWVYQNIPK